MRAVHESVRTDNVCDECGEHVGGGHECTTFSGVSAPLIVLSALLGFTGGAMLLANAGWLWPIVVILGTLGAGLCALWMFGVEQ